MPHCRITYMVNIHPRKFFGYRPEHEVVESDTHSFAADSTEQALSAAWSFWNADDRPNGQTAPSASIGDVFMVRTEKVPGVKFFTVASIGFEPIEPPIEFIPSDPTMTPAILMRDMAEKEGLL